MQTEEEYQAFLKTLPANHESEEFINALKLHNEVVLDGYKWLVIKNRKYDGWLTAFYVNPARKDFYSALVDSKLLINKYGHCEWLIKAPHKRSVKLFHIHLIENMA